MKPAHLGSWESLLPSVWGSPSIGGAVLQVYVGLWKSHSVETALTKAYSLMAASISLG